MHCLDFHLFFISKNNFGLLKTHTTLIGSTRNTGFNDREHGVGMYD